MSNELIGKYPQDFYIGSAARRIGGKLMMEIMMDGGARENRGGTHQYVSPDGQHVRISFPPISMDDKIRKMLPEQLGSLGEFKDWHDDPQMNLVSTPYGVMQGSVFRGADGKYYSFDNFYMFTMDGDRFKYEGVREADKPANQPDVAVLEVTPNPEDSRVVDLDPNDYEKIEILLHQIENGEFVREDPNEAH